MSDVWSVPSSSIVIIGDNISKRKSGVVHFLDLPLEIRDSVYKFAVALPQGQEQLCVNHRYHWRRNNNRAFVIPIYQLNRQIRNEAIKPTFGTFLLKIVSTFGLVYIKNT